MASPGLVYVDTSYRPNLDARQLLRICLTRKKKRGVINIVASRSFPLLGEVKSCSAYNSRGSFKW